MLSRTAEFSDLKSISESDRERVILHTATADYYVLLTLLLQAPTAESVQHFMQSAILDDFTEIALEMQISREAITVIAQRYLELQKELSSSNDALGLVRREYTRLFSHPTKPVIKLYEGVFTDDERVRTGENSTNALLFVNPSAADAERLYKQAGFACSSEVSIPADAITTEMEFLGRLHNAIALEIIENDNERVIAAMQWLEEFHSRHSSQWFPRFFERCEGESKLTLYKLVGYLGTTLIKESMYPILNKEGQWK